MWGNKDSSVEVATPATGAAPSKSRPTKPVPATDEGAVADSSTRILAAATPAAPQSLLGASLQINGEIAGTEDLQVDCKVDGSIHLEGRKVTVGPHARIVANIMAAEIIVYGNVKGNLSGRDRVEIMKDGSVVGELATSRIMIEDGAYFRGTISIECKTVAVAGSADPVRREDIQRENEPSYLGGTPTLHLASSSKDRAVD
jgi:cytoskeletal protein CcmA (bactofilin family)